MKYPNAPKCHQMYESILIETPLRGYYDCAGEVMNIDQARLIQANGAFHN